ncbi:MAG: LEA type 2 family protein [Deltaproteobacteria bacterium]|nr:LEA type 2 family protein [Deltaproteobacteria bacterium]
MKTLCRVATAVFLLFLISCLSWWIEKPALSVKEILVDQISSGNLRITLKVEAENPNRFDLTMTALDYTFFLNNREVGRGSLAQEVKLPASAKSTVELPVTARLSPTGGLLKSIFSARESVYKIEGTARVSTALGSTTFPFTRTGSFKLKKP